MKPSVRVANSFRALILAVFWTSPYRWLDAILEALQAKAKKERTGEAETKSEVHWRDRRYLLSDLYITLWLLASVGLYLAHASLPDWAFYVLALRCFGILNKEMGVVIFGVCKVTEGMDVSASGRVMTLAIINYCTALFCFASLHGMAGGMKTDGFVETAIPLAPLLQSAQLHFALSPAFPPDGRLGYGLVAFQSAFVFFFATMIIALFVSLLDRRSHEDRG